ncbi:MAG: cytochrome C oxidase subunit IV family protein [Pseudomonadota bacterium]|nr:cytochrome C oxidase subunit IV family protein [Pseudomonadota bacterium]
MNHQTQLNRRLTWIWLALMAFTILTYAIGKSGYAGTWVVVLLLVTVFIKGHWIIADFMELRHAGLLWRVLAHGWIILVSAGILVAYMMGMK